MRLPTFSRQSTSDTTETPERPAPTGTVTRPREDNTTQVRPVVRTSRDEPDTAEVRPGPGPVRARHGEPDTLTDLPPVPKQAGRNDPPPPPPAPSTTTPARPTGSATVDQPVAASPKPRASLLATLGLILGVASVLLVLSGPLMGYGIGVAGLALILSLSGIHATGKRHVAGKTDALLGMILSLGAIVLGVLALTGSLNWLGTDTQPVNTVREWLDARFIDRF
ncbi:hypothetical protein M1L60_16450 [Actinoplanes sp. TRM 88003]|uniref:Uncharacterized protein n=1 Tax=Paractinoplanes aksuensis TaxID=2939490 RepID=A0ABT1DR35_9ACTN|nr:hypothetical protein [Actinoplanes aksuensis]MCO8272186.1 hypothetical protein [Actinoplanes aksuensis]